MKEDLVSRIHISCYVAGTRVDSLQILFVDESWPGTTRVHNHGNNDRPEDGVQSAVAQAMCAENPQGVLCQNDDDDDDSLT